jgi:thiol-disulfide isomerase/thioredoxin
MEDLVNKLDVKGSADNERFFDYLRFLNEKRPESDNIRKQIKEAEGDEGARKKLEKQLDKVNESVTAYQNDILEKHPESLTALIIKSTKEPPIPEFEGTKEEIQTQKWLYYREHYFDYLDLSDPRILRSPVLFNRVTTFINKLTVQHPDSISMAVDRVLEAMKPSDETFKYYLVHFLNEYAGSKIVGMDAVYVHLVEKYYMTGMATWTEEEQLQKIIDNAKTLKPILIGKTAPDLHMQLLDLEGTILAKENENEYKRFKTKGFVPLHEVRAPYIVLVFWAPDCGHCKKSMPKLGEFYQEFNDKGVEVDAVCSKTYKDMPACAEFLKERNLTGWINAVDPFFKTKFKTIYDIRTTPQVFVLDDEKEILIKRIGIDQLKEVMNDMIKREEANDGSEKSKP